MNFSKVADYSPVNLRSTKNNIVRKEHTSNSIRTKNCAKNTEQVTAKSLRGLISGVLHKNILL